MTLGIQDGQYEQYAAELERAVAATNVSEGLRDLWSSNGYDKARRMSAVDGLAGPLGLSPMTTNFLRLLVDRQRTADLAAIASAYRSLVDEKAGRLRAVVTTAAPVSTELTEQVGKVLQAATGKQIVLETRQDPKLIGGVVAQVGSTVFDGSLKTQLEKMKEHLLQAPLAKA